MVSKKKLKAQLRQALTERDRAVEDVVGWQDQLAEAQAEIDYLLEVRRDLEDDLRYLDW